MDAKGKGGGREVALGLNSGVFNSSVFNSGVFNNASFGSFSNLQDFPFFESLTSLGDLSALGAAFHQSVPSLPEHLAAAAAAQHAAATAAAAQQGSSANLSSLNLARNDSFANLTQSSLQNLQLFLTEVEQGVIASGQVQQQQQQQQQQHSPQLPSASPVQQQQQQQQQQQHVHQSQQAQPLPPAAYAPVKATQAPPHHPALQPKAAPTPIAPAPIYPSPSQFAAFSPSMQTYPHPQQHSTQQWGPRPGLAGGNAAQSSPKLPLTPSSAMMMAQQSPSLAPIGGPAAGVAVPQEFSSTLYSLASTLPPPMILSNDSVLGSVGGGLHFQRHCVRRRMPDELAQPDPSMFLN